MHISRGNDNRYPRCWPAKFGRCTFWQLHLLNSYGIPDVAWRRSGTCWHVLDASGAWRHTPGAPPNECEVSTRHWIDTHIIGSVVSWGLRSLWYSVMTLCNAHVMSITRYTSRIINKGRARSNSWRDIFSFPLLAAPLQPLPLHTVSDLDTQRQHCGASNSLTTTDSRASCAGGIHCEVSDKGTHYYQSPWAQSIWLQFDTAVWYSSLAQLRRCSGTFHRTQR